MNNSTIDKIGMYWQPDKSCFDWCTDQHVTYFSNLETKIIFLIVGILICLLIAEYFFEKENYKEAYKTISISKILIYIFFFVYIIVIKMGLYNYANK